MEYFESPAPTTGGLCSLPGCDCPGDGIQIPVGQGYLYIPRACCDFRWDCCTMEEVGTKMERLQKESDSVFVLGRGVAAPILICEVAARKLQLNLEVAEQDAKHWWTTSLVPFRPTPRIGEPEIPFSKQGPTSQAGGEFFTLSRAPEPPIYSEELSKAVESFKCPKCRHPFMEDNPLFPRNGVVGRGGRNVTCTECGETIAEFRWYRWVVFPLLGVVVGWVAGSILDGPVLGAMAAMVGFVVGAAVEGYVRKGIERRLSVIAVENIKTSASSRRPSQPRAVPRSGRPETNPQIPRVERPKTSPPIPRSNVPQWLERIAGAAALDSQVMVSWPFIPPSNLRPGVSVDDGLRALPRRAPEVALATWRRLIEAGTKDPEPFLFASMLIRTSRRWWLDSKTPGTFDKSLFAEAVLYSQETCRRDPKWPDGWFTVGEWLVEAALAEGTRRGEPFSLESMLHELQVFGLAVECLRKASELDNGRLRVSIESFGFYHHSTSDVILNSAGQRASEATVRSASEILRRSGVDDKNIKQMPSTAVLLEEMQKIHNRGDFLIFVCPPERFRQFAEAFAAHGLNCRPGRAFGAPGHEIGDWYRQTLKDGIAFISSAALAFHPCDWFQSTNFRQTAIRCVDVDRFSLLELVGALTWTSLPAENADQIDRIWHTASLETDPDAL